VYNKLDLTVLTQDAQQRTGNEWTYTKYDAFGKVVVTGLFKPGADIYAGIRANVYNAAAQWEERNTAKTGYTNNAYPVTGCTELTVNFYDEYGFTANPNLSYTGHSVRTQGLPTGSKVREDAGDGSSPWLFSVIYYDFVATQLSSK
jgi:hypothetical protein